jgi:hypothetical protein
MATPYCECYRPHPAVWAPADPFGSRAAPLAATAAAVRIIGPLIAAATALLELPWHTASFSGAAPVVFFSLATVARAGARLRRLRGRVAGGSRRRLGAW